MDNQDIFNKIKSAAENAETKKFPGMEKVWSRIDAKLDDKVEKKQNNNWKKLMIAASVLLIFSIGYQFLKSDKNTVSPNENSIVTKEIIKNKILDSTENNAVVTTEIINPIIKENADEVLQKQITTPNVVANSNEITASPIQENNEVMKASKENVKDQAAQKSSGTWLVNNKFESRGVAYEKVESNAKKEILEEKTKEQSAKKLDPIIIVDGKATNKTTADLNDENIESILELPNPIYYINSVLYTEEELFGPNPTSPYAPLNKQKIESTTVLTPEKATKIYGQKGKNGVVIITTKDGKPAIKKK